MNDSPLSFLGMTAEQRERSMRDNPPECTAVYNGRGYFDWSWSGCGFGQLSFSYDRDKDQWSCDTECMGPDATRQLLHAFADHVADQLAPVILRDEAMYARDRALRIMEAAKKGELPAVYEVTPENLEAKLQEYQKEHDEQQAIFDKYQAEIEAAHRARIEERAAFRRAFDEGAEEAGADGL